LYCPVDGDLLIIAQRLCSIREGWGQQSFGDDWVVDVFSLLQPRPEVLRRREVVQFAFDAGAVVKLDDARAVRRIGEL
jgi:hypothetical protein